MKIIAISAMDEGRLIGADGGLPWDIQEDKRRFFHLTKGHTVLMGRKTYESKDMPKPLPKRHNIVCTRYPSKIELEPNVSVVEDAENYLKNAEQHRHELPSDIIWVIGGEGIYELSLPYLDEIELTYVFGKHEGDTYFPEFEHLFKLQSEEKYDTHSYRRYVKK